MLIGWTDAGSPNITGLPDVDAFVSRLNSDAELITTNECQVTEEFGDLSQQIIAGLIARDDGAVFRRRNGVWACVSPHGHVMTLGDAALMCGCARPTLSTYIVRGLPRGNLFPSPDMFAGHSGDKPMRLWWPITVLRWISRRPGKGYRSDWCWDMLT